MAYSVDLRERVVAFVRNGGSKTQATKVFKVSRGTVYDWLSLPEDKLEPEKTGPKGSWKLDCEALKKSVAEKPDAYLEELAQERGVHISTVWYGLEKMKITRKKNDALRRTKRGST